MAREQTARETETAPRAGWRTTLYVLLGLVLLSVVVFRSVLPRDAVLFSTDNNIGHDAALLRALPEAFFGFWESDPLVGQELWVPLSWTPVLLWLLPLRMFVDWIHAIDLGLGSLFFFLFLRARGRSLSAALAGSLIAFWLGSNLTLTYAGHTGKYGVLMFAGMALWCIEKSAQRGGWVWPVLTGFAVGNMFIEQQDVALFFGVFLGLYALFAVVRVTGWRWQTLAVRLLPMAVLALVVGGPATLRRYVANVPGVASMSEEDPAQKWEFCTQWSVPPEEMLEFVAPGFYGWRSHEPAGPYWGRLGRSAEWSQRNPRGFRNLKLDNGYVGAAAVLLAVLAIVGIAVAWRELGAMRGDIVFWACVAVVTLLLALGKFFPLYRLWYMLPGMDAIRNPNKFLHVFQFALGILAAYGLDFVLASAAQADAARLIVTIRRFLVLAGALAIGFVLWAGATAGGRPSQVRRFADAGWGNAGGVMVDSMVRSLVHAGIVTGLCAGVLALLVFRRKQGVAIRTRVAGWLFVVLLVADVLLLGPRYIKPMRVEPNLGENAVIKYLKQNLGHQRVLLLSQSGFYNKWLSMLFPYHGIPSFNVAQMPRMPEEYKRFLNEVGKNPVRLWRLASVGYVLAPANMFGQLANDPRFKDRFEPVLGFNVFQWQDGIGVAPPKQGERPQHLVLRFKDALPRYSLVPGWETVPDDKVCERLRDARFDPARTVLIAPDQDVGLSEPGPNPQAAGQVTVLEKNHRLVRLRVKAKRPCMLLAAQKHAPGWRATVDGERVPLLRCDYLLQGVRVDAGVHELVLLYFERNGLLWLQAGGTLLALLAAGMHLMRGA